MMKSLRRLVFEFGLKWPLVLYIYSCLTRIFSQHVSAWPSQWYYFRPRKSCISDACIIWIVTQSIVIHLLLSLLRSWTLFSCLIGPKHADTAWNTHTKPLLCFRVAKSYNYFIQFLIKSWKCSCCFRYFQLSPRPPYLPFLVLFPPFDALIFDHGIFSTCGSTKIFGPIIIDRLTPPQNCIWIIFYRSCATDGKCRFKPCGGSSGGESETRSLDTFDSDYSSCIFHSRHINAVQRAPPNCRGSFTPAPICSMEVKLAFWCLGSDCAPPCVKVPSSASLKSNVTNVCHSVAFYLGSTLQMINFENSLLWFVNRSFHDRCLTAGSRHYAWGRRSFSC
jgi:hypothetical protein